MAVIILCEGNVTENNAGRPACDTGWLTQEYSEPLTSDEYYDLTAAIFLFFALAFGIRMLVKTFMAPGRT
jgi:hypothetical protein